MSPRVRALVPGVVALAVGLVVAAPAAAATATGPAPGAPGTAAAYLPADKSGVGTSTTTPSRTWLTVQKEGGLGELFYPDLSTPSARALRFLVADTSGHSAAWAANPATTLTDGRSLSYRQTFKDPRGRWQLTASYATDPARNTVLADVALHAGQAREPLHRLRRLRADARRQPHRRLGRDAGRRADGHARRRQQRPGRQPRRSPRPRAATATPATARRTCSATAAWTGSTRRPAPGNLVQTGPRSTGKAPHTTIALGFGGSPAGALSAARGSLATRLRRRRATATPPAGTPTSGAQAARRPSLRTSDQRRSTSCRSWCSPPARTRPTAARTSPRRRCRGSWGRETPTRPVPPGLVARPLPDRHRADRRRRHRRRRTARWTSCSTAAEARRLVPAELDRRRHAVLGRPAARRGRPPDRAGLPARPQRRRDVGARQARPRTSWSASSRTGTRAPWTPAGALGEPVAATPPPRSPARSPASSARPTSRGANGDTASADRYLATADDWQSQGQGLDGRRRTARTRPSPYFLRLTKDGNPNAGTTYTIGDSGPADVDQRTRRRPELPRPGPPRRAAGERPRRRQHAAAWSTSSSACRPRAGSFWHRASFDGYGEKRRRRAVGVRAARTARASRTAGRWPLLNGERGEYQLAAGAARRAPRRSWPRWRNAAGPGRHAARAGVGRPAAVRAARASRPARRRSRRRRWPGRTRSSSGWRWTWRRAACSSSPRWWPRATPAADLR